MNQREIETTLASSATLSTVIDGATSTVNSLIGDGINGGIQSEELGAEATVEIIAARVAIALSASI